jgi:hypothetical protein
MRSTAQTGVETAAVLPEVAAGVAIGTDRRIGGHFDRTWGVLTETVRDRSVRIRLRDTGTRHGEDCGCG